MSKKIAVFGVGAIGGLIGGYLARAGHEVTLIDTWPANVDRIRADGLTVTELEGEFTVRPEAVHLGEVSASRRTFDIVFLTVKSYDTEWSSTFLEPHLAPGGFMVSAQNGINEDTIAGVVGWSRVLGCVVTLGAELRGPGNPHRTSATDRPAFKVGEPMGSVTARLEGLADILGAAGPASTTTNLWGERWSKLTTNSMANSVAGFTGLNSAELRRNPATRDLAIQIAVEVLQVADALGIKVEPIGGIPAHMYLEAGGDGEYSEELVSMMVEGARALGSGRPSLGQDMAKGRRTEVDHLNGYVVAKGKVLDVPTPINEAVVDLTKRVEAGELEPSPDLVWLILG